MKSILSTSIFLFFSTAIYCQQVDSIAFHLYTDSLKKGQHNYINVDGKLSDGHWLPLTAKEIQFSTSAGRFEGNDLILPADIEKDTIKIKAILKSNPLLQKEITVWIKKLPDPVHLPHNANKKKSDPARFQDK